jgi:hypothetical protein
VQYLNCPRCGLAIQLRDQRFARSECPRCRVRADVAMPMYMTQGGPSTAAVEPTARV